MPAAMATPMNSTCTSAACAAHQDHRDAIEPSITVSAPGW
jgi:hypothetical protein